MIREEALACGGDPKQGHYTVQDYLALPDRPRVELIDGYLCDLAAPSFLHQQVLRELVLQIAAYAETHPECEVLFVPFDVCINNEQWSIVQPEKQKITIYDFEHDELPVTYTFHDNVPVTISNVECSVDFQQISEKKAACL